MKFTFLGTGSAFTLDNYQSNMVLQVDGKNLLIDAGGDVRHSLREVGLTHKDIHGVYISHLHADHIGGLEWLGFATYFSDAHPRMPMYVNERVADQLWENCLRGGMASHQNRLAYLDTYFDVHRISRNCTFEFEGYEFRMIQTVHYMDGYEIVPSFGLMWTGPQGARAFLTTDTQFVPDQLSQFYRDCDIIFQDCETSAFPSGLHAHYEQLKTLPDEIRAKMWLYHYQDGSLPDAVADGFAGFANKGQTFEFGASPEEDTQPTPQADEAKAKPMRTHVHRAGPLASARLAPTGS